MSLQLRVRFPELFTRVVPCAIPPVLFPSKKTNRPTRNDPVSAFGLGDIAPLGLNSQIGVFPRTFSALSLLSSTRKTIQPLTALPNPVKFETRAA
jgi:hypothetical protein